MIGRLIDLSIDRPLTVEEIERSRPSRLVLWAARISGGYWWAAPFIVYALFWDAKKFIPVNLQWLFSPVVALFFFSCAALFSALITGSLLAVNRFWFRSGSIQSIALTVEDSTLPAQRQWLSAHYLEDAQADLHSEVRRLSTGTDARKYVKSVQMQGRVLTLLEVIWLSEGLESGRWQRVLASPHASAIQSKRKGA